VISTKVPGKPRSPNSGRNLGSFLADFAENPGWDESASKKFKKIICLFQNRDTSCGCLLDEADLIFVRKFKQPNSF
jgi:hypothetical protein